MTTKSSDLSKKVHSYFSTLSSASSRILDDVRNISLTNKQKNHRSWNNMTEKERADIVISSLVSEDIEQRYRSLPDEEVQVSCCLESMVDTQQAFPVIKIHTGERTVVFEEEVNGRKVPITWRDEHSAPFSWYNHPCEPVPFPPPTTPNFEDLPRGRSPSPRRESRSSTPTTPTTERRRSPVMRPKQAPPPPPKEGGPVAESGASGGGQSLKGKCQSSESVRSTGSSSGGYRKRQAPKPPVSPIPPSVPEKSSTLSLNSVGSSSDRPRSTFCPSDSNEPHMLPEALAPEQPAKTPPMLHNPKVPQQLKKVEPPTVPKIDLRPKNTTSSIATTPVVSDDIPKTGFDFLDNW